MPKDLTLEINASHPTIINLNTIRKSDPSFAEDVSKIFLDQILQSSNVPFDYKEGMDRKMKMMESYLDQSLGLFEEPASRRVIEEAEVIIENDGESVLK